MNPQPKPVPQKDIRKKARNRAATKEKKEKQAALERDQRHCRFPLCGCLSRAMPVEVAHVEHKGMGSRLGRAHVNVRANLLTLCHHRHQDAAISIHHGTLTMAPATDRGTDGPMIWTIDTRPLGVEFGGVRISIHELESLQPFQQQVLDRLAKMDV